MAAGYSGTPLAKKLGIKEGHVVALLGEPSDFRELVSPVPDGVTFQDHLGTDPDVVVVFHTEHSALLADLDRVAEAVFPDRMIWFAWPKRTSGVDTDLTGDAVRAAILSTKLVDVKVCAISEIWSGLKAVWRKEHR